MKRKNVEKLEYILNILDVKRQHAIDMQDKGYFKEYYSGVEVGLIAAQVEIQAVLRKEKFYL